MGRLLHALLILILSLVSLSHFHCVLFKIISKMGRLNNDGYSRAKHNEKDMLDLSTQGINYILFFRSYI